MTELEEFVQAQDAVWPQVTAELSSGRKTTHWIWYVFPQLESLGRSQIARHFGLGGLDDAAAYMAHPVLGPRLVEAASLLFTHKGTGPETILGPVDALKVRSCMTLFEATEEAPQVFSDVIDTFYDGTRCPHTRAAISV